jgi:hypothetical protein
VLWGKEQKSSTVSFLFLDIGCQVSNWPNFAKVQKHNSLPFFTGFVIPLDGKWRATVSFVVMGCPVTKNVKRDTD